MDLRDDLEDLAEEVFDQGASGGIGFAGAEDPFDPPGQSVGGGGIEDSTLVQAGRV
jgi:hypothetical protein